jgi:hypothetical protein
MVEGHSPSLQNRESTPVHALTTNTQARASTKFHEPTHNTKPSAHNAQPNRGVDHIEIFHYSARASTTP